MAYKQNAGRGKSDSYASMISSGLINKPGDPPKKTHVEKDGVTHEVIGNSHIKSPSGKIIKVSKNDLKKLYKQTNYESKRTLEDIRLKDLGDQRIVEEIAKNRIPTGNEITE